MKTFGVTFKRRRLSGVETFFFTLRNCRYCNCRNYRNYDNGLVGVPFAIASPSPGSAIIQIHGATGSERTRFSRFSAETVCLVFKPSRPFCRGNLFQKFRALGV